MAVLILLAAGMIIFLLFATFTLKATGRPLYNEQISRTAKTIWGTGFAIALGIVALMLGPGVIVATWPFWIGTLVFTVAVFGGLDRLFIRKPQAQTHAQPDVLNVRLADYLEYRPDLLALAADVGRVDVLDERGNVVHTVTGPRNDSPSWRR